MDHFYLGGGTWATRLKRKEAMLATSLMSRLEFLQESVNRRLRENRANGNLLSWFADRKGNVDAQRVLTSDLFNKVSADFALLLDQLKAEVGVIQQDNRITLSEAVSFIGRAIKLSYAVAVKYAASAEDRKATVVMLVDEFYARILAPLDLPFVPNIAGFENRVVDPLLGKALHYGVDGLYDVIVDALVTPTPITASTLGSPLGSSAPVGSPSPNA